MPRVSVGSDLELYCEDVGEGPVVLLVHGGCMSHRVWESQVTALLEAGYRVVAPDLRGHGASDKPEGPYTATAFADDVAALADALGIESFALVGWSLGATVVATLATRHPEYLTRLVLVSSGIFDPLVPSTDGDDDRLPLDLMLANQRRDRPQGMERFVDGMFGESGDEWTLRWLWSIGMQTPMRVALETLRIYDDPEVEALRDGLAALDVPGAVFHGALDAGATLAEAETVATDVLADGTFVPFHESGHVPFLEESERFEAELLTFLAD
jgi:pimeloyl-[acyl-carrier protein] methyl ester esterase